VLDLIFQIFQFLRLHDAGRRLVHVGDVLAVALLLFEQKLLELLLGLLHLLASLLLLEVALIKLASVLGREGSLG